MAVLTEFSDLTPLPCESRWFRVYRLTDGVTAIYEPYHFQEVISYLIEGEERALLLDSGMGLGNMRALVETLTDKPITLVNSHNHFDHVGDNWRFETTHLLDIPEAVKRLEEGYSLPADDENRKPSSLYLEGEPWFDLGTYSIRPCTVKPIHDGDVFELGGRTLRVIATPGHSRDGIMLADDAARLLFTGDTVYPAPLYAYPEGADPAVYARTVESLAEKFSDYTLVCSHNNPLWEGQALREIAEAFRQVLNGEVTGGSEGGYTVYPFGTFSIVL